MTSGDVLPDSPLMNATHRSAADAVGATHLGTWCTGVTTCSNSDDVRLCEFCKAVLRAHGASPFGNAVGAVISARTEKQMVWSNAGWVITTVKHTEASWGSVGQTPGEPMGIPASHTVPGAAVPQLVPLTIPNPAPISPGYLSPEPSDARFVHQASIA